VQARIDELGGPLHTRVLTLAFARGQHEHTPQRSEDARLERDGDAVGLFDRARADPLQGERLRRLPVGPLQALEARALLGGVRQQRVHGAMVAPLPRLRERGDGPLLGRLVTRAHDDPADERDRSGSGERSKALRAGDDVTTAQRKGL
jgi:hypothetical protein